MFGFESHTTKAEIIKRESFKEAQSLFDFAQTIFLCCLIDDFYREQTKTAAKGLASDFTT